MLSGETDDEEMFATCPPLNHNLAAQAVFFLHTRLYLRNIVLFYGHKVETTLWG